MTEDSIMNERSEVATRQSDGVESAQTKQAQARQAQSAAEENVATISPAVDISEDARGITLRAEMPGVSRDRLEVHADRNGLSIQGDVSIDIPSGMQALYADVQATRYQRSFTLSGELDPERIDAQLKDGVLTVQIPKRAEFQPRRIEVRAG